MKAMKLLKHYNLYKMIAYILIILALVLIIWNGIKIEIGSFKFEIYPLSRFF
jgi:cell division protein FtsX